VSLANSLKAELLSHILYLRMRRRRAAETMDRVFETVEIGRQIGRQNEAGGFRKSNADPKKACESGAFSRIWATSNPRPLTYRASSQIRSLNSALGSRRKINCR
jgi:hypothetical protein